MVPEINNNGSYSLKDNEELYLIHYEMEGDPKLVIKTRKNLMALINPEDRLGGEDYVKVFGIGKVKIHNGPMEVIPMTKDEVQKQFSIELKSL